jgi:MoaA/NifB/PqqE/SkfB family radical SAM enzyme
MTRPYLPTIIFEVTQACDHACLHCYNFRREVHDMLSGSSGAFDAVLAALANIRYYGGQAVAVFVATRRNIADLYDALKRQCPPVQSHADDLG